MELAFLDANQQMGSIMTHLPTGGKKEQYLFDLN